MRRVVEPLLTGGGESRFSTRDLEYGRELGLIAQHGPLRIANPIYAEVVPRELAYAAQEGLVQETAWYVDADGALNLSRLLAAFQEFFREHFEHWIERFQYREAGPQGLTQTRAYMERCGAAEGHLVVFDRTEGTSWDRKMFRREETAGGPPVTVWGM